MKIASYLYAVIESHQDYSSSEFRVVFTRICIYHLMNTFSFCYSSGSENALYQDASRTGQGPQKEGARKNIGKTR
jgi:hypothetical protein